MGKPEKVIFIADDIKSDLSLLKNAFLKIQPEYEIISASDGEELLKKIEEFYIKRQTIPSMVLLDLNAPKLNSVEILKMLKAHFLFKAIPVLLFSSEESDRKIVESYKLGVNTFFIKPADEAGYSSLVDTINKYWFKYAEVPKE